MRRFANLLERLVYTQSRNEKLRLLAGYFAETPDPDRGWAVAALAGTFERHMITASAIRKLVEARTDPVLFRLSYDYVGDLAETVSLIWPDTDETETVALATVVTRLRAARPAERTALVETLLDRLGQGERFAFLKLATGGMRVGVSARLLKRALADYGGKPVAAIEELWFGLAPPYESLFAWLEGRAGTPDVDRTLLFRPAMLAHSLEPGDLTALDPADFVAEWKWDGIRIQAVSFGGARRLYTRTGDDIGAAFPDLIEAMNWEGVVDGELLVVQDGAVQPFHRLQRRLGRKAPSVALMAANPAHIRAYDLLELPGEDLRPLPLDARRQRLEAWFAAEGPARLDLSPALSIESWVALAGLRGTSRDAGHEGLMVKRRDSPYLAGRVKGHWYKWKRDPLTADCVLMYAQRGHGKRSSYYSDFTFGCWQADGELAPVGKAYSGFTDAELQELDKFVRDNTGRRFGPMCAVSPKLVLEVAFDAVQPSTRHKSGLALRFPRIKRIRWDKPAAEADTVAGLSGLVQADAPARYPALPLFEYARRKMPSAE